MRQIKIQSKITNRDSKVIDNYFADISSYKSLTIEEEKVLIRRYREAGDRVALEKLIKANLKFVVSVAKNYYNSKIPLSDLISEGNIGLMKALDKYDETRNFKFFSYAVWWIRQSIMQSLNENERIVRLPSNKSQMVIKINSFVDDYYKSHSNFPSPQEVCEGLKISNFDYNEVLEFSINYQSLSSKKGYDDEDSRSFEEMIPSNFFPSPEDAINKNEIKKRINTIFSLLPSREADILRAHFEFVDEHGNKSKTIEQIQYEYEITETRINQLKNEAIIKLRSQYGIKKFKDLLS